MAYNPGALDAALTAAVGRESPLIAELRRAFIQSAQQHIAAMARAKNLEEWQGAAARLHSLAASFGSRRIMDAAICASRAGYVDATAVIKIERAISALNA
jgi:histidine phosphotransfer protein HptB